MSILGLNQFDQCVLNISLINLCNRGGYIGQEIQNQQGAWATTTDEPLDNPWLRPHQFTIYIPHPEQEFEGITLEAGLTQGYNIEVKAIEDPSQIPYNIPVGGHFVVILKQKGRDNGYDITATGIFIRPLALLSLDIITDKEQSEYRPVVIKHPVIRDYPSDWQQKIKQFINQEIRSEDLPNLVGYVDQTLNQDYRPPSWNEVYLMGKRFALG